LRDETNSEFLDTLLGTSLFGTLSQVSKKIPAIKLLAVFFVPPFVLRSLPRFFKLNSEEVQKRIDNRGSTQHPDFVDYMLPAETNSPMTKKETVHLEQVVLQLFVAGYDPIQIVLNAGFFFLVKEPEVYQVLVEEIRDTFRAYESINVESIVGLKYLHAFLYETMRVHITNGTGLPRISPGAMVDGFYVPQGVVCQQSPFSLSRSSEYFRDPHLFRPQRWLPASDPRYEPRYADDQLKSFYPFGIGPRMCVGREIAWQQMKLFMAKVLWTFDIEGVKGMDKNFDDDFSLHAMWNRPHLWVKFHTVKRSEDDG
jgi:cytochrome P450